MVETCDEIVRVLDLCQEKNKTWDVNKRGLHLTLLQNSFSLNAQRIALNYNTLLEVPNQSSINEEPIYVFVNETAISTDISTDINIELEMIEQHSNEMNQDNYNIFNLISTEKLYPYTVECQLENLEADFPILLSRFQKIHNKSFSESTLKTALYGSNSITPYEMDHNLLLNIWKY
jgi:hypothetical protein